MLMAVFTSCCLFLVGASVLFVLIQALIQTNPTALIFDEDVHMYCILSVVIKVSVATILKARYLGAIFDSS